MRKLVIIPAYNESGSIQRTIKDIQENAPEFDYIVVNDCSTDGMKQLLEERGDRFLDLAVNLGIGGAVQTGYRYAAMHGYDAAVQFDGDGQHSAVYLGKMAELIEAGTADMVIGSRFIENEGFQSSGLRRIGIRYFTALIRLLTGQTITDPTSGMRMVNRPLIERFSEDYPKDYPEPESVVSILTEQYSVEEVPVRMNEREEGTSSISLWKSVYYMIKVSIAIWIARLGRRKKRAR